MVAKDVDISAIADVVGDSFGALVVCIPGQLIYYEAVEPFTRFIGHRRT